MRGYDGKTTKNNITDEFSFSFGDQGDFKSDFDAAAVELYKALGEKSSQKDCDMTPDITKYFTNCILKDEKLVWRYVKNETAATIKSASSSRVGSIHNSPQRAQESPEDDEQIIK